MKRFPRHLARTTAIVIAGAALVASAAVAVGGTPTSGPLSKPPTITPPSGPPSGKLVKITLVKGTGAKVGSPAT